jgi:flagellar basal body rod protein FlgG
LDAQGRLVLPNARPVLGDGREISIPAGQRASLRGDGAVETTDGLVGRLQVVQFTDPARLEKVGNSLIRALPGAAPEGVDRPRVAVGFVEQSNVTLAAELAALIQTARAFEAAMRGLRTHDELSENLLGIDR